MNRRIRCRSCRTTFVTDDLLGRPSICPKCGSSQDPQTGLTPAAGLAAVAEANAADEVGSVFVPSETPQGPRRGRRLALAALALLAVAAVSVVVAWPTLRRWWNPVPPDPVEAVASAYLQALADRNTESSQRLGTVDLPPAIRSFRSVRHERELDSRLKGSFAPITAFHARLDESYTYDPTSGRFTPKNALGPAAETLDALHDAKAEAEKSGGLYEKMRSANPDDLFDAAEQLARPFAALSKGILSPRKLIPSYKQLVEDAKPPLPPAERTLALDFGANRETWDLLLKRPYVTLKADGPFVLERAEVTATVIDALGSSGDPPTPLRLTLTRFRLEGIDTGWRVTSARREGVNPPPDAGSEPLPQPTPPEKSGSRHD